MATPITLVWGVGSKVALMLAENGYQTAEDLAAAKPADLVRLPGFGFARAEQVLRSAREVAPLKPAAEIAAEKLPSVKTPKAKKKKAKKKTVKPTREKKEQKGNKEKKSKKDKKKTSSTKENSKKKAKKKPGKKKNASGKKK